jgi:tetratricopeptide (TPR) repeat protein
VAIDWRRVGLGRPIRDSELRKLYPEYLASIRAGLEPSDDLYNGGLAWACKPVASHVALLEKANVGVEHGFVAFDYLVALLDGQHAYPRRDVLPVIWDFVIESLSEEEVLPLGVTAYLRNDPTTAGRIWRNVAGGSSTYSGEVAYYLGILLKEQGDTEGAREAYQEAIDSGHPDAASKAMNNLGVLLEEQGDIEGARAAYQRAIDSGHTDEAPNAALNLGNLLSEQGDIEGARAAYQRAIDSGHTDRAPMAVVNLGVLLGKQGDDEGAREAFQRVIDSGHPDQAPKAIYNLGVLLEDQGDIEGAREAFQRVIDSGHPDQAPKAIYNLGVLLHNQGNTQGARAAYQKAIDSGHPEAAPKAEDMLNDLNQ